MLKTFLVVPPGLEKLAASEYGEVFPSQKKEWLPGAQPIALEFDSNFNDLLHANVNLRIPNRILVRLASFRATNFEELVKKARRIQWEDYLPEDVKIAIRSTCKKSKLYHSDAVSQRIHTAIQERLARKVNLGKSILDEEEEEEDLQLIIVRNLYDQMEISIDSSGQPLYKRGYRLAVTKAPLRENLAAAMIYASGWDGSGPLLDPFCGSGTVAIEAAQIRSHIPPGANRRFRMQSWPVFLKQQPADPTARADSAEPSASNARIYGSDRDAGAIEISTQNSRRANVEDQIEWRQHAFSDLPNFEETGWIVTNPPYGHRISETKDLRNLYAQFGNILRKRFSGWKVLFLCSQEHLTAQTQLDAQPVFSFSNGGIKVQAYYAEIE